jgi:predicted GH43/DUF377 family glycosyl hydrolase
VFNPGAIRFNDEVLLLVRVEDRQGYSHLTLARSKDGRTNWQIDPKPTLESDRRFGEDVFGLEDPRIVWVEERQEYVITCVSFFADVVGEPPGISLIATKDFSTFQRLGRPLMPPNKDASLFSKTFKGRYALMHRPVIEGRADIWVSFSPDMKHWGEHRALIHARHRSWDVDKIGLGPPPIETKEGWLIIYHGSRITASGGLYRIGLALLDLETLEITHRSKEWVFAPKEYYEMVGDVDNVIFPCGTVVKEDTDELLVYYGAGDSVVGLAIADLGNIITYMKSCPES